MKNNCPKCGKPTTDKDYYWHNTTLSPVKKNPNCKECVSKKNKLKTLEKSEYSNMFI